MSKVEMFKKELHMHEEFSGLTRLFHWLRALCIFTLIATGFYIAYPFLTFMIIFSQIFLFIPVPE